MKIKDKIVIVTGASSGIGLATAKLLGQKGARVVLAARSINKLKKIAKEIPGSIAVRTDMRNVSEIKNLVKKTLANFGRIDVIINNAGQGYDSSIEKTDMKKMKSIFDLNFIGPFIAMQQVIPVMRKQGGGAIVNISSGTSLMHLPEMSPYSSSKRALNGITLTAREELEKDGICVSLVYPFITDTDFEKNTLKEEPDKKPDGDAGYRDIPPADPPEFVAAKIVEAVETGKEEVYAHDFMKKPG